MAPVCGRPQRHAGAQGRVGPKDNDTTQFVYIGHPHTKHVPTSGGDTTSGYYKIPVWGAAQNVAEQQSEPGE